MRFLWYNTYMNTIFKEDKKSLKTRERIKVALSVLLKTKTIDTIKILEITKLAKISRNSFYTHYRSIADVTVDIFNDILTSFNDVLAKYDYYQITENPYPLIKELTFDFDKKSSFVRYVVFAKDSSNIVQMLIDYFTDFYFDMYVKVRKNNNKSIKYLINFIISGAINFMYSWYKNDNDVELEKAIEYVSKLIKEGIIMIRDIKEQNNLIS